MRNTKPLFIIILILLLFFAFSCKDNKQDEPIEEECIEHVSSDWLYDDPDCPCGEPCSQHKECIICGEWLKTRTIFKRPHELVQETIEATCTENGKLIETCKHCDYIYESIIFSTGHKAGEYETISVNGDFVEKVKYCSECGIELGRATYVNNGWYKHGKLSVNGRDLVDKDGKKIQLYGISTHGLQWFGKYIDDYKVYEELNMAFSNNVIRLSLYTGENGYCESGPERRAQLKQYVINGVNYATKIGMYVIIDWHMLGATDDNDKNPLYYVNESKEFFSEMSLLFKDNVNVLYEIMNEPNGNVTWAQCKEYALEVIPCIRANSDGIILVGNPHWTSDLASVLKDPIKGYDNLMYTYHFYADDHKNTNAVVSAYNSNLPVFISEYGYMYSTGDGDMNYTSGNNWIKALDSCNISYVAWNLSNSKGSASILQSGAKDYTDFSDSNLKEWGIFLKQMYRKKSGLIDE